MTEENKLDFPIESLFGGFSPERSEEKVHIPEFVPPTNEEEEEEVEEEVQTEEIEIETEEESEEETEETEDDDDVEYSYKALASHLAEQGILDFEDSEDVEDTPEVLEAAVINTAKNMIQEYKDSIPEEGKQFLNYLEKGGDPRRYLEALAQPLDFDNLDITNEDAQKTVIREFLKTQEYSLEEIEDELKDYEDALILEKKAKTAAKKLEGLYKKQKDTLIAQQEQEIQERQKDVENYINQLKSTINNAETLGGLQVSGADKKEFEKYLLARDKEGLTQYEKELRDNPIQTSIELAYLKFKKFDFSKVANKVKTQEARRLKDVFKAKDTTVKGKSTKVEKHNPSDLSAFKNHLV